MLKFSASWRSSRNKYTISYTQLYLLAFENQQKLTLRYTIRGIRCHFQNAKLRCQMTSHQYLLISTKTKKHLFCVNYSQSTFFQSCRGRVFLGWTSTRQRIKCLAQGHNAVPPMRHEPRTPRSRVKPSTSEPPCSTKKNQILLITRTNAMIH